MSKTAPTLDDAKKVPPPRRSMDLELQAMARIDRVLADFPTPAVHRILAWHCLRQGFFFRATEKQGTAGELLSQTPALRPSEQEGE